MRASCQPFGVSLADAKLRNWLGRLARKHGIHSNFNVMILDMKLASTEQGEGISRGRFPIVPERSGLEGLQLEFTTQGHGEPLLTVHGGLLTGWFDPLSREPALADRYRLISYHRPGYGSGSRPSAGVGMADQAACCLALMRHLGVEKAHVVGHSIGGCIALQLALDAPEAVASLGLLEPPVLSAVTDPSGTRVIREAGQKWQQGDENGAFDLFMTGAVDPSYRKFFEDEWPEGLGEALRGASPFFTTDQPSVQAWKFTAAEAARITHPVLLVIGDGSDRVNPIRSQVQRALLEWLPNSEPFTLPNTTHLLPLQNPAGLAEALVQFYVRIG